MIIGKPTLTHRGTEVTVEATVELESGQGGRPSTLWFTFPAALEAYLSERADGYVAALLPLAMWLGEDLTVHGELSVRLAAGARDYQRLQTAWKPTMFRPVEVRADRVDGRPAGESAGAVGTAFSGGVDSFHTLWAHHGENEPYAPYRITHALMINGFDLDADLDGTGAFLPLQRLYESMLRALGVELVVVRTNLLQFVGTELLKQSFAAFVTAPALLLGRLFARYHVPSSYKFTCLHRFPDGSHPAFDHLIATEATETIHDGGHLTRVEKTVALSRWPVTFDHLRVCINATGVQPGRDAVANCCNCEKCLRTMTTLEVAGALGRYGCFPHPLTRGNIRRLDLSAESVRVFENEIIAFAEKTGRDDIARDLRRAIWHSVLYRKQVRSLMLASYALEHRSPLWAALVHRPKRLIQRTGIARGWLYWKAP